MILLASNCLKIVTHITIMTEVTTSIKSIFLYVLTSEEDFRSSDGVLVYQKLKGVS